MQLDYKQKYIKYKGKYEQLKQIRGGGADENEMPTKQFEFFINGILEIPDTTLVADMKNYILTTYFSALDQKSEMDIKQTKQQKSKNLESLKRLINEKRKKYYNNNKNYINTCNDKIKTSFNSCIISNRDPSYQLIIPTFNKCYATRRFQDCPKKILFQALDDIYKLINNSLINKTKLTGVKYVPTHNITTDIIRILFILHDNNYQYNLNDGINYDSEGNNNLIIDALKGIISITDNSYNKSNLDESKLIDLNTKLQIKQ
jgi:hypothetical protein